MREETTETTTSVSIEIEELEQKIAVSEPEIVIEP